MLSTLSIKRPSIQTLMPVLLILAVLMGVSEVILRQQPIQAYLTPPSLNTSHRQLERQWHRLENLTKSGVQLQCIALGNSMILNGFEPQVFSQSFYEQTGQELHCFNFGVDALTPVSANGLAQVLIDTYRPQLLIFGTDARDYAVNPDMEETTVISEMAWLQYRLGSFNLTGWLLEHSYLYRYRYSLVDLMRLSINRKSEPLINQYGFEAYDATLNVTTPPDPNDNSFGVQYYYKTLDRYTVRTENQQALAGILARQSESTTLLVIAMPVPDTYFYFFDNPSDDYNQFINALKATTANYNVLFLETAHLQLIPNDGWADYSHLNNKGAVIFSKWLGKHLGKAVLDGRIDVLQRR